MPRPEVDRRNAPRLRQRKRTERPSSPGCRVAPCRPAARGTGRAVRVAALVAAAGSDGLNMAMATGEPEISGVTVVARMPFGIFRVGSRRVAARIGPGVEVAHGIHDAAAELAELRAAADHALLLQRARRQAQVLGGFVVGQVALGLRGRSDSSGGRPQGAGRMGCTSIKPGHTTRPDRGTFKKARLLAKGRIAGAAKRPLTAMQLAGVAPGCDSRRASAPRHGAPTAARGHARRCPCASRPRRHPRRTTLRPLHARTHPPEVASSACKVCSSSTAAGVGRERAAAAGAATVAADSASSPAASAR